MNTAFSSRKLLFTRSCIVSIALALAGCGSGGGGTSIVSYYVASNGSDSNPGTITQPYLTIQKCATTFASGSACQIRAGTYHETVTPNSGVIITSYNGELVTVDGTDPVSGWQLYQGSIYGASAVMSTGDTNQVFAGQQMMTEARWPNGDDLFHVNWATAQSGTTPTLLFDSTLPSINWTGAKIHFWSGTDPWSHQTATVTSSSTGQLTFTVDGGTVAPYVVPMVGGYYYVFGALGLLDTQREWFYDNSAGMLYFWAPGGVNPNMLDVRIKTRQYAFDLSSKSNVTIQNINIFASAINTDGLSTNNTITGITASYVSHFTTSPSLYAHFYDSGIVIFGSGNVLTNSTIAYSAGNGVTVLGTNINVQNNLIHHTDYIGNESAGISIQGTGHKIQNNTIYATGRSALTLNDYKTGAPSYDNISYNNLFNTMMLARDGGAIYAVGQPGVTGTRIHHNWIHDTQSLYSGPASTYPLSGVYLDEDTSGWEVDQNVLWNNEHTNIFLHGSTKGVTAPNNNKVHNNSIIDLGSSSYIQLQNITVCGSTQIVNNYVLTNVIQTGSACAVNNNNSTAPGATEMTSAVKVGCNFTGCSSSGPPTVSGGLVAASIATQPYSLIVSVGQSATFSVTGVGSAPLSYQWQKNGVNISGAIGASYTIPPTIPADSGTVFSVTVSNFGSVNSSSATLTVQ
jgi:hypothetical protein